MKSEKASSRGKMSLEDWINEVGVAEVAKLFKVNESAVRHWKRGHCLPRTEQMRAIHQYSKGRVSYEEMIEGRPRKTKVSGA
jgi:hypothetical protein